MSSIFSRPPDPPTDLGYYRILSKRAGIRVSPLQLGAMSIGEAWQEHMGSMSKESAFKLLDAYFEAGGNTIDTSNNYQSEQSELWIGEWMKARGNRDQLVIATKFTLAYKNHDLGAGKAVNHAGNHKRALHMSLRDSLKKLQTDFIDVMYLHVWDYTTSIEEIMDSLHMVVESGKVLYLGVSDTPAWIVSAANYYAQAHGKSPFVIYQGRWNLLQRDFEREILPMARHFGMALAPWDVMAGGKFQSKEELERRKQNNEGLRTIMGKGQSEEQIKASEVLCEVAEEHGIKSPQAIALAYVMAKAPNVYPIIGGRKVEHLHANIESLKIKLTDAQIEKLESIKPFDVGFPHDFVGPDPHLKGGDVEHGFSSYSARFALVRAEKPIGHE